MSGIIFYCKWYNIQTIINFDPFLSPEKPGIGAVPLDLQSSSESTAFHLKIVEDVSYLING